jgi:hypothetical protein
MTSPSRPSGAIPLLGFRLITLRFGLPDSSFPQASYQEPLHGDGRRASFFRIARRTEGLLIDFTYDLDRNFRCKTKA